MILVFEGLDRAGKTTQTKKTHEWLESMGVMVKTLHFPDRSTELGKVLDKYLKTEINLCTKAAHLLFSANRWEHIEQLKQFEQSKTNWLLLDRYYYSGAAYSCAKDPSLTLEWCLGCEEGLPAPDMIFYFSGDFSKRENFGNERYEISEFQQTVATNFEKLFEHDMAVRKVLPGTIEENFDTIKTTLVNNFLSLAKLHKEAAEEKPAIPKEKTLVEPDTQPPKKRVASEDQAEPLGPPKKAPLIE